MKRRQTAWLFLIVPAGFLILACVMVWVRGDFHYGQNIDPEYQYLASMVNLATGKFSHYVHHPGTPLQIIGTVVVALQWLISGLWNGWQSLPEQVLGNPLSYLRTINVVLVLLLAGASFWLGWRIYRTTGSVWVALAVQISPFLFQGPAEELARARPETLVITFILLLVAALAPAAVGKDAEAEAARPRVAVTAGALLGLGIATKALLFTFLPFALLFPGPRQRLRFLGSTVAAFAVTLVPVLAAAPQMARWFLNMATHTGHYGTGPVGLPAAADLWNNARQTTSNEPFLYLFLAYYVIVLIVLSVRKRWAMSASAFRALTLCCVVIVLHSLAIAKHPNYHYVLPAALVTLLANASVIVLMRRASLARPLMAGLIVIGSWIGYEGLRHNFYRVQWYSQWVLAYRSQVDQLEAKRAELGDCEVIGFYPSSAPTFPFFIANEASRGRQWKVLEKIYPGQVQYAVFDGRFMTWEYLSAREEVEERVSAGACVLIHGGMYNHHTVTGFQLEPVFLPDQSIYGVEGLWKLSLDATNPALIETPQAPPFAQTIEAEEFLKSNAVADGGVISAGGPAEAEYVVRIEKDLPQAVRIRYASETGCPVRVLVNGAEVSSIACLRPTGGRQLWHEIGNFQFEAGRNTLTLRSDDGLPKIDKIAVIPLPGDPEEGI